MSLQDRESCQKYHLTSVAVKIPVYALSIEITDELSISD